jgi:adenylate kinase
VVIKLEVPGEAIIGRCELRFKAEGRADDDPDTVRKRLDIYAEQTAPVANFYAQRGKLKVVNGVGEVDEVSQRILDVLQGDTTAAHG